jgi:AcrR family transcriptional regulator
MAVRAASAPGARRLQATEGVLPHSVVAEGTRGRILEAALRLFAETGYAETSIRGIAAASGVQSASLYAHFPSKEHILAELAKIGHDEHHRALRAALLESDSSPANQLAAVVRAHVLMHTDLSMLAVVSNTELHSLSPEMAAPVTATRDSSVRLIEEVIQRGVDVGEFDAPHVWLAVAAIGAMGIRVAYWFTSDFELDAEEVANAYAEFALRIVNAQR